LFHYVASRLLWLVPTILAMALVTFLVMHATPGSPLDPVAEGANPLSPEAQKALAAHYGLDKPLWQQFTIFLTKAVQGDFGYSFVYKTRTVAEILKETFPISLFLGAMALVLAVAGGLTLGILAAVYQNRGWDYVSVSLATVGVAVPNFVLAVFLIILFSFIIPLFPTGGWDSPRNWVLPTITLALAPMGIIARFTRASMLEVIRADYTLTARAKGLAEVPVIFKHALKNALIPVVTLVLRGVYLSSAGDGTVLRAVDDGPGLSDDHGRRALLRRVPGRHEPARRPGLWRSRPPDPLLSPEGGFAPLPARSSLPPPRTEGASEARPRKWSRGRRGRRCGGMRGGG
jgi:peptide/nickel transport system permease protein